MLLGSPGTWVGSGWEGVSVGEEGPGAVRAGSLPVGGADFCWGLGALASVCESQRRGPVWRTPLLLTSLLWEGGFPELAIPGCSPGLGPGPCPHSQSL